MNFLFDQNISFRLIRKINDVFPNSKHVKELGLENATDIEIFDYAKKNNYSVVTFDSDFCDLNTIRGFPPKIIWIRTGNITTKNLEIIIRLHFKTITNFHNEDFGCLEIIDAF
ncbi:MAG TPA: hypothetical protein DDZ39_01390 [Flavobacteriaceae bacterium]|jgi:predicted nuclease of predicted toxin-antitoxin system|nr:hypothetical protein [Flavobacteriaceae bacterium]HBS11585.1 hypothetical protein [Flavobacteriaceae bacterium]